MERMRLFGYVVLKNGEVISINEARCRLAYGHEGDRRRERQSIASAITKDGIVEYHAPQTVTDYITSISEVDVPAGAYYPSLDLSEGTVISDPKISHRDPLLFEDV
jgi:hypothetical protein